jgi:ATP-dependent helicase/nuclease subunit A
VTLLFRASSGFPYYEEAFEAAGIPFVTVAGSGFYDRPEVRDVLNLLRALSDPWDDQAMAGFLRSPAVGLSDPALYLLRYQQGQYLPLRQSLDAYAACLPAAEHPAAERALAILQEFAPLVDRLPVAELLRRLVARLDSLAVLAAAPSRLWRNVGKLLGTMPAAGWCACAPSWSISKHCAMWARARARPPRKPKGQCA